MNQPIDAILPSVERNRKQRNRTMTTDQLKNKVLNLLIKWGSNPQEAVEMVAKHFDSVSGYCHTAKRIAECIGTIA
jgi:formylmethanofuran dehydrogenase subunit B